MNAVLKPEVRLEPLTPALLDEVLRIENSAYAHPWTRGNFADSLMSGYQLLALMGGNTLIGYFVAMEGVDEVHLLNITVAPAFQGQGYGVLMLDALAVWARSRQAHWLWLEVRVSNVRAMQVYARYGFRSVGERKNYYPAAHGQREHAVVMSLKL
jgi:ribosomal-protein-alanine N-acetyltransferase